MKQFLHRVSGILKSKRFFWAIIGFFIFESVWIAISAVYPQAFDEDFHFGLIKVYSHYWLPFLTHQPANANQLGAVAVDPSYLYHYLMSFPYRLITLFTKDQTIQIILLRLINVGLLTSGLLLFRKVLERTKISKSLINVCLAIFVLIPIVPQLGAHINYDNLLFPLIAWVILLTFNIIDELKKKQFNISSLLTLLVVCLLTSLVKDAFLSIFLGVILYLIYLTWRTYRHRHQQFFQSLKNGWQNTSKQRKILIIALLVIALGLFAQRDLVNIAEYHTIEPNCSAVLSVKQCSAYSVWFYSYQNHQTVLVNKSSIRFLNPFFYLGTWLYWMWYRLFFAVNGSASQFTNYPPLPLPSAAAAIIGVVGVIAVIIYRRKLLHNNPYLAFLFVVCGIYILALLADGYAQYHYTDELVTMNGRYLIPILLLLGAIIGSAFSMAFKKLKIKKTLVAMLVLLLFLQGGGFLTFITRSDTTWYWPNSIVIKANNAARKITKPIIIKGSNSYSTSHWFFN